MTLKEFFDLLAANPYLLIAYFGLIPLIAFVAGLLSKGEGHKSPWKYLYSTLVYLICIPGIFSIALNIYLFLFQKQNIFNADIYTQIFPILSMFLTLLIIKRSTPLEYVPGFDRLSGLFMTIFAVLVFMWLLDRTRIFMVSIVPFYWVGIIFLALLFALRVGMKRIMK